MSNENIPNSAEENNKKEDIEDKHLRYHGGFLCEAIDQFLHELKSKYFYLEIFKMSSYHHFLSKKNAFVEALLLNR